MPVPFTIGIVVWVVLTLLLFSKHLRKNRSIKAAASSFVSTNPIRVNPNRSVTITPLAKRCCFNEPDPEVTLIGARPNVVGCQVAVLTNPVRRNPDRRAASGARRGDVVSTNPIRRNHDRLRGFGHVRQRGVSTNPIIANHDRFQ